MITKRIILRGIWLAFSLLRQGSAFGLSFDQAQALALQQAPQISASSARIEAARQQAIPAGSLPDPQLALGVDNLPIQGSESFSLGRDFMTMQRIGLSQTLPNPGKLEAQTEAASQQLALAEAESRLARLQIQQETAVAWINRYLIEKQLTRLDALQQENQGFAQAAIARFAGGGPGADALTPRQDQVLLEERRDELQTRLGQAVVQLKRWVGDQAGQMLIGAPPEFPISARELSHGLHQHPELDVFEPKTKLLSAEARAAEAGKIPDFGVQLAYQHRGPAFGDMVSFQVSVDLPIFTDTRKEPLVAAKLAERAAVADQRKAALLEHQSMLESDLAEHQRLQRAIQRHREQLTPLARQKAQLALADWQNRQGELSAVFNARREYLETELKTLDLENQRLQLAARLHYNYSRETLPEAGQ